MGRVKELQKQVHMILQEMEDDGKRADAIAHLAGGSHAGKAARGGSGAGRDGRTAA